VFFSLRTRRPEEADDVAAGVGGHVLPAAKQQQHGDAGAWNAYAARQRRFQAERATSLRAFAASMRRPARYDLGRRRRKSECALTVMRHFDSATVVQDLWESSENRLAGGLFPVGAHLLLLVAGYDVYGNITHNLNSRLYMDFLRMRGGQFH